MPQPAPSQTPFNKPPLTRGLGGAPLESESPRRKGFAADGGRGSDAGSPAKTRGATTPLTRQAPLKKRPKGRIFVGFFVLSIFGTVGFLIWNSFLRYNAYGVVTGRVIAVPAQQSGIVRSLYVREGDFVQQGQLLARLENLDVHQRIERLGDELKIAQADLDAELSQYRWQLQISGDQNQKALAEYYELWGKLLQERARLAEYTLKLQRTSALQERGAQSDEQLETARFNEVGQRAHVEKLAAAVAEMKKRVDLTERIASQDRLRPQLIRIETLQAEISRLRDITLAGAEVRAPVPGRVVKWHRFTGEFAAVADVVAEILEEGSLEAVVYVPQHEAQSLQSGDEVVVVVAPNRQPVRCQVVRLGDQYEEAPDNLRRYYRHHEKMLPVYLRPGYGETAFARIGCEVKLPANWSGISEFLERDTDAAPAKGPFELKVSPQLSEFDEPVEQCRPREARGKTPQTRT